MPRRGQLRSFHPRSGIQALWDPRPRRVVTLIGTTVRNIRLAELVGEGGMGEVYLGIDETLGRNVAVKAIRGERRLDAGARSRFLREARVLSRLEHPNICRLYDFVQEAEDDFIVLGLVPGRRLRELERDVRVGEAIGLARRSFEIKTRELGPDHPSTMLS